MLQAALAQYCLACEQHALLTCMLRGACCCPRRSTLSYHQLPFADLADAARSALTALRARRLLSLKPEGPSRPSAWELTPLGEAVVASMLPPDLGLLLHSRMSNLMSCLVLGGHLHLLFMLQPDPLFAIYDWNAWARLTKDFTAAHKCVHSGVQALLCVNCLRRQACVSFCVLQPVHCC